jgi:hypothetical protein
VTKKKTDADPDYDLAAAAELEALEAAELAALEEADRKLVAELAAKRAPAAPVSWYEAGQVAANLGQAAPPPPEAPAELRDEHGRIVDPKTGQPVVIAQPGSGDEPDRDQYGRIIERPQ